MSWSTKCIFGATAVFVSITAQADTVRIGWIGGMTGPTAKYGAYQAAQLAQEDINREGGINGRPLELIFEDGKGNGKTAVSAGLKLISANQVKFIVGGHSTPESLPLVAVAERNKVALLAAITSSPKLTSASKYFSRVTAVSIQGVKALVPYIMQESNAKRFAVLSEETDYALPLADAFVTEVQARGGVVPVRDHYQSTDTDFRASLLKIKAAKVDGLYISIQSPDACLLILQQLNELGISLPILGNELTGNAVAIAGDKQGLFEGLIFAEPQFDANSPQTKAFIEKFKERFHVAALPYGIWTAEAYDAVRLLASVIQKCGEDVENVILCLRHVKDYSGISGSISIDENGDGLRRYVIKKVVQGIAQAIS